MSSGPKVVILSSSCKACGLLLGFAHRKGYVYRLEGKCRGCGSVVGYIPSENTYAANSARWMALSQRTQSV